MQTKNATKPGIGRYPLEILPELAIRVPGHVDIPKMREGKLGGAFFTAWAPCPETLGQDPRKEFMGRADVGFPSGLRYYYFYPWLSKFEYEARWNPNLYRVCEMRSKSLI
jgi:hypothetical protein